MRRSPGLFTLIAGIVLAVIVTAVIWMTRAGSSQSSARTAASEEEKSYLQYIVATHARVSAAENFLGHAVTYLDVQISNRGTKTVRELELHLEFQDTLKQVVLRETERPITPQTRPLQPGQTVHLHLSFEQIPPDWNQAPPTITPTRVRF